MKKLLAVILTLSLLLSLPAMAEADAEYGLVVGGVQVTPENQSDIFGDGTAIYSPENHNLYLNSAKIYTGSLVHYLGLDAVAAIYAEGDLTVNVNGDCEVGACGTDETDDRWAGILCGGNLSFVGTNADASKLLVLACDADGMTRARNVAGIQAGGGIRFATCTVQGGCGTCDEAYADSCSQYGILCNDVLDVQNANIIGFTSEQALSAHSTGVCPRVIRLQGATVIGMSGNRGFAFGGMLMPDEYTDISYLAMFCTVASGDNYDGSDVAADNLSNYVTGSTSKKFVADRKSVV